MSSTAIPWKHLRNVLVLFAPLWVGTAGIFMVLGLGYAIFASDTYTARIGLVVRDEATTSLDRLGRFPSQTEMKAAQETVLEMVQNDDTIRAALKKIGPPSGQPDPEYPDRTTVKEVAESVNLLAPKGAEFGGTEVVYLQTKARTRARAKELANAMYESLTAQHRSVRSLRADSVIAELTHAQKIAETELQRATETLRSIEVRFGEDLGELRNLRDTISGEGSNRRTLEQLTVQLQEAETEIRRLETLREKLLQAADDPNQLLIAGSDLLAGQPSLQRLKDGLIDAQLQHSALAGVYTENNPKRRAAAAAESQIRVRMQNESRTAAAAIETQLSLQKDLVTRLSRRQDQMRDRLDKLAEFRTRYSSIDSEVKQRTETLARAQTSLAEAEAARSAALSTDLVARFGDAHVSEKPIGPGGTTIVGGSTVAGLLFGLGIVFLVAPGPTESGPGRRWTDYVMHGRRQSDRIASQNTHRRRGESAGDPDESMKRRREDHASTEPSTASDEFEA